MPAQTRAHGATVMSVFSGSRKIVIFLRNPERSKNPCPLEGHTRDKYNITARDRTPARDRALPYLHVFARRALPTMADFDAALKALSGMSLNREPMEGGAVPDRKDVVPEADDVESYLEAPTAEQFRALSDDKKVVEYERLFAVIVAFRADLDKVNARSERVTEDYVKIIIRHLGVVNRREKHLSDDPLARAQTQLANTGTLYAEELDKAAADVKKQKYVCVPARASARV